MSVQLDRDRGRAGLEEAVEVGHRRRRRRRPRPRSADRSPTAHRLARVRPRRRREGAGERFVRARFRPRRRSPPPVTCSRSNSAPRRATEADPNGGLPPQAGTADDKERLSAFLGGAAVSYHAGEQWPALFRLGAGVLVGQLRDEAQRHLHRARRPRSSTTFLERDLRDREPLLSRPRDQSRRALRQGRSLSLGVDALVLLALSQPTWSDSVQVNAPAPTCSANTNPTRSSARSRSSSPRV